MGRHAVQRWWDNPDGDRLERLAAEAVRLADVERNATDALAQALGAAYDAGLSVRRLAELTGLSKSRVDRLHTHQLTTDDVVSAHV
jgi:hypothetical protein